MRLARNALATAPRVFRRGCSRLSRQAVLVFAAALVLWVAAPAVLPAQRPPEPAFVPWFTDRGIAVEIARMPSGPPWIRGRGEVPAAAAKVAAVLSDFSHYRDFFGPAVRRADVLDHSGGVARLHLVWPFPFPYSNRDAVVRYEVASENGGCRVSWRGDARAGDPKEGTRIERVEGEARVETGSGVAESCRVTYTYLGDLGGKFPAKAEEKAWREEPVQYFRAIRRRLGLPDLPK